MKCKNCDNEGTVMVKEETTYNLYCVECSKGKDIYGNVLGSFEINSSLSPSD